MSFNIILFFRVDLSLCVPNRYKYKRGLRMDSKTLRQRRGSRICGFMKLRNSEQPKGTTVLVNDSPLHAYSSAGRSSVKLYAKIRVLMSLIMLY